MKILNIILCALWALAFVIWVITMIIPKTRENKDFLYPALAMQVLALVMVICDIFTL